METSEPQGIVASTEKLSKRIAPPGCPQSFLRAEWSVMSRKRNRRPQAGPARGAQAPAQSSAQGDAEQVPTAAPAGQGPPADMPTESAGTARAVSTAALAAAEEGEMSSIPTPPAEPAHDHAPGSAGQPPAPVHAVHTPPADTPAAAPGPAQEVPTAVEDDPAEQEQRHGPIWSASEAARRCGIGRATMTRRLQAGAIPGATRDEDGHWQVPLSGLLAAGLHPDRPAPPEDVDLGDDPAHDDVATAVELAELRGMLAVERARREAAEQLAAERAARVDDLRRALLALEPPGPAQEVNPQPTAPAPPAQEPTPTPAPSLPQDGGGDGPAAPVVARRGLKALNQR